MAIEMDVPGMGAMRLEVLVLDYNGTVADRGRMLEGVDARIRALCHVMEVHILTADTFGTVRAEAESLFAEEMAAGRLFVDILLPAAERPGKDEGQAKLDMLRRFGAGRSCAMGNGRNDEAMLEAAALSFGVMGREGCSPKALAASDIAVADIRHALDILLEPRCGIATLRL